MGSGEMGSRSAPRPALPWTVLSASFGPAPIRAAEAGSADVPSFEEI